MPRWPEDSRERLTDAAFALFSERGYSAVTVHDIAQRAGVSSRTFFRHFPDKEEVLFADDERLLPALIAALEDEPSEAVTAEADMLRALSSLASTLEPQRGSLLTRQRIVEEQVSLSGRELVKQAAWQRAITEVLVERGYAAEEAELLAAIGFAVFRRALHSWLAEPAGTDLRARIRDALPRVRSVLDATTKGSRSV